jgi:hypothetical protein
MGVAVCDDQIVLNFEISEGVPLNFVLSRQDARSFANAILTSIAS